jgi:hypothetical protein
LSNGSVKKLAQGGQLSRPPLAQHFYVPNLSNISKVIGAICARNNSQQGPRCKYLLVFVCTFSGWMEAFPTLTEKVQEVARCLLKEIMP